MANVIFGKSKGGGSGSGVYSQSEKLANEMEMEFKSATPNYFKELVYDSTSSALSSIEIWTSSAKTIKLFSKEISYDGDDRVNLILLTRISDGVTMIKTLTYDGDNLDSIEVSIP